MATSTLLAASRTHFQSVIVGTLSRTEYTKSQAKYPSVRISSYPRGHEIMEKTRYFRSSNQLNAAVNLLSGNLLPLGDGDASLSCTALLWVICMWAVKITYVLTGALGSLYFAGLTSEEMFKKSGAMGVVVVEAFIPTAYLNLRRKEISRLINEYNNALIDSDHLRQCVHDTLEPYRKGLKFYMIACFCTTSTWSAAPILGILDTDRFTYADLTVPAYFPGETAGQKLFFAYVIFQVFGSYTIHFAKMSVDLYVIHFIALLAAQYKFVGGEISRSLSEANFEKDESSVVAALHQCVRHHVAVIQLNIVLFSITEKEESFYRIGRRLTNLMALYIGATYLTCIFKFCFLAFGIITFGSANVEKVAYLVYIFACFVQVFLLCSAIQDLLVESTSVTEDAFHENWHARSYAVKQIFYTIEVSNQLECRLNAYGIVDLVVPTMALILSKSYSVCLLLLKIN